MSTLFMVHLDERFTKPTKFFIAAIADVGSGQDWNFDPCTPVLARPCLRAAEDKMLHNKLLCTLALLVLVTQCTAETGAGSWSVSY